MVQSSKLFDHTAHNDSNYMGSRKVITNLWKDCTVYTCIIAIDSKKPGSFRLFLCTVAPEEIAVETEKQTSEEIHSYNA